ncbi:hypothetical protein ACFLTD_03535 [Elusimicrobiota bacterium]
MKNSRSQVDIVGQQAMKNIIRKILCSIRLDDNVFYAEKGESDSLKHSLLIILLSSLLAGIAGLSHLGAGISIQIMIGALLDWFIWSYIVYLFGMSARFENRNKTGYIAFISVVGIASAPGIIRVVGIIPPLYLISNIVANILMIISMSLAVNIQFSYDDRIKALKVCVIAWVVMVISAFLLSTCAKGFGFI